jgi:hypothetical protein
MAVTVVYDAWMLASVALLISFCLFSSLRALAGGFDHAASSSVNGLSAANACLDVTRDTSRYVCCGLLTTFSFDRQSTTTMESSVSPWTLYTVEPTAHTNGARSSPWYTPLSRRRRERGRGRRRRGLAPRAAAARARSRTRAAGPAAARPCARRRRARDGTWCPRGSAHAPACRGCRFLLRPVWSLNDSAVDEGDERRRPLPQPREKTAHPPLRVAPEAHGFLEHHHCRELEPQIEPFDVLGASSGLLGRIDIDWICIDRCHLEQVAHENDMYAPERDIQHLGVAS